VGRLGEAALAWQPQGAVDVDPVEPHPHAGGVLVPAQACQVGPRQRGAALGRRLVRRVADGCRRLARPDAGARQVADAVRHLGRRRQDHQDGQQRGRCLCLRHGYGYVCAQLVALGTC